MYIKEIKLNGFKSFADKTNIELNNPNSDGIIYYTHDKQAFSVGILGVGAFLAFWGFRSLFALVTFLYPIILFILLFKVIKLFKHNANHVYRT